MHITADFITKLPLAQEYDVILVIYDQLTKIAHFVPITEKNIGRRTSKTVQKSCMEVIWIT